MIDMGDNDFMSTAAAVREVARRAAEAENTVRGLMCVAVQSGAVSLRLPGDTAEYRLTLDGRSLLLRDVDTGRLAPLPVAQVVRSAQSGSTDFDVFAVDLDGRGHVGRGLPPQQSPVERLLFSTDCEISLTQLILWLSRHGLAIVSQPPSRIAVENSAKGGRPAEWDWDRCKMELFKRYDDEGLPSPQRANQTVANVIAIDMSEWFKVRAAADGSAPRPDQCLEHAKALEEVYRRSDDQAPVRLARESRNSDK